MTVSEHTGDEVVLVHAPSGKASPERTPENARRRDFRDTQSLALPLDRICEPDDPQVRQMQARAAAVGGTEWERVNFLEKAVFVRTPDVIYVLSTVDTLLDYAGRCENPGGMRVHAPSGMGKDALIRFLSKKYPAQPLGPKPVYPLVSLKFAKRLAPGDILRALLNQMNCAYLGSQSIEHLEELLISAMDTCGTRGVIFNEAQHMLSAAKGAARHSARVAGETGDWLKLFIEKLKRPVFFFGVPGWDEAFVLDPQLGSRVPHRHEIPTFKFDETFMGVLRALDEAIPMPEPSRLTERTLAYKLFLASKGVWRPLINLMRDAIVCATRRGSPRIEISDLSWAYQLQFGQKDDPFSPVPKR